MSTRIGALILFAAALVACRALSLVQAERDQEGIQLWGRIAAPTAIQLQSVFTGLTSPVLVTNARDGSNRLFVIEQPGLIKVAQPGASTTSVFLDLSPTGQDKVLSGGERGLLGLAFHPQYSANRRFFVNYTRKPDGATVIAEYQTSAGDPNIAGTAEIVLLTINQPFANHNGGMVEFGPDGFLHIGMGDGGSSNDPGNRAQDLSDRVGREELLGKMLRIDVDLPNGLMSYSSPPDNPFFGGSAHDDEIYAYGMRNPFRFSFDRGTGQLWAGDVGQGAREEIDIITRGGNYGWRVMEGMICNPNLNGGTCTPPSGSILPTFDYAHTGGRCSITGGYVYRGGRGAVPVGNYIYGDFCTGEIFQLQGVVQSLLLDTSLGISAFGEDEAGEIYVVNLNGGSVFRIANTSPPPPCAFSLSSTGQFFSQGGGQGSFGVVCAAGCNWIVASNRDWITITSNKLGSGTDSVNFVVRQNFGTTSRTGAISVAGLTLPVIQAGSLCTYAVNTATQSFGSAGGVGAINVTAPPGCSWTAASNSSWIIISSGSSGNGSATVTYSVQVSQGPVRIGAINVAGRTVIIKQKPMS